jgi:alkyl sulfatase BDS1-like metallo-beta-lactamase superfamily hydrolase
VVGADRVVEALTTTAEMLESLHQQALDLMNAGARLDDLIHSVTVPQHLADRPWLQPLYDEPEFVVRSVWRLYGGWWDGNPATLKPAADAALAAELADLAGGAGVLAERAVALAASGTDADLRLAGHLAELAVQANPHDPGLHRARAEVFARRVKAATSTMAKGVFAWTVKESTDAAGAADP